MKTTFIGKEKNEVTFDLLFSAEEFNNNIEKVYLANRSKYSVDGFRKGKAPRKMIEMRFGMGVFFEDALNELITDGYANAVEELGLKPVDKPNVDLKEFAEGADIQATIKVTVRPEFVPGEYKGIEVPKITYTVSEEDITKELEALQERNSRAVVVEREAQNGDTLRIDYSGFCGDEQFEGGTATNQLLTLGSESFIPGFEAQLIGTKTDEDTEVKVTFPVDYHAEKLAGKEAIFKVSVKEIKETQKPEIDDEFAKDVSEFDTLEELKESLKVKLEGEAEKKIEYDTKNAILEKIYEITEVDIPEVMVEAQIDEMMEEFEMQLKYQGISTDDYLGYIGKNREEFRTDLKADAYKKLKTRMIVDEVANIEKIEASQEEIDKEIAGIAEYYKIPVESIKEQFQNENFDMIIQDIRNKKTIQLLMDSAIIK